MALGRFRRVPTVAPAAGSVRARVPARRRDDCRRLGRRESTSHSRILVARGDGAARRGRSAAARSDHRRHAARRAAAAGGFARYPRARESRRPRRAHPQPCRQHRCHAEHRAGHDPRPDDPAGFPESNMEMRSRSSVVSRLFFLLLVAGCGMGTPGRTDGPYDLILSGGWSVYGSGNPLYRGDLAVTGDRIAAVGYLGGAQARDTLDVTGLGVAHGLIDMPGPSDTHVLADNPGAI